MDWLLSSLTVTLLWMFYLTQSVSGCPEICHCSWSMNLELLVDCSGLGLRTVPGNLPSNTTFLNISGNHIEVLENYTFSGLPHLSRLDLSHNKIFTIGSQAFQGLDSLITLSLHNNNLCFMDRIFCVKPNVFAPLFHLEVIDISDNYPAIYRYDYLEDMWLYLTKLKELYMDPPPYKFNDGFLKLKNLQTLSLCGNEGYFNLQNINNDTFWGLRSSPIEKLDLGRCNLVDYDGQAFQYMPGLIWLSLANNPLVGQGWFFKGMGQGFSLISLRHLDLNGTLPGGDLSFLWYNCHWGSKLTSFTVSKNSLFYLGPKMTQCLPKLELFSFSYNSLFINIVGNLFLFNMPNIRVLDMSWQRDTFSMMSRTADDFQVSNISDNKSNFSVTISPTLEILDISHNHLPPIPGFTLVTPVNLWTLRAVDAGISNITKSIYCQYTPIIQEIDVANNSIYHIHQDVFTKCNWTAIMKLRMSGNMLGDPGRRPFFNYFSGLVELDLSHNDITYLHPKSFENNTALRILQLSYNRIVQFPAGLSNLKSLQFLDVSHNLIAALPTDTIKELKGLLHLNPNLTVDVTDNPLRCFCDWLPALRWMANHPQHFKDIEKYKCDFHDFTTISFAYLDAIIQKLARECDRSLRWLYIPILVSLPTMMIVVAFSVFVRWRFMLEVTWYKPRSVDDEIEYEFDSFVVYSNHDKNWVQTHLCRNLEMNNPPGLEDLPASRHMASYKLCCHHRDFLIGRHIIDNITEAFDKSRTTLIAMSNSALCGKWWQLELQMAVQTAVARKTSSLLFIFLEPLQGHLVTPQLRRILNTYTCKRWYPGDLDKQQKLWKDLKIAIKFPRRNGLTMGRQTQ